LFKSAENFNSTLTLIFIANKIYPSPYVLLCMFRSAYIGDGYVNGSGCVHIAVICFISLVALIAILAGIKGAIYLRRRLKNKM